MKKIISKNKYLLLTVVLITATFLSYGINSFHNNIWYDEAYSMILNRNNIHNIIKLISLDTAPPGHALLLKFITTILGSKLYIGRLLSFAIYSIQYILAFYPIRKLFGDKTALIFSFLILLSNYAPFTSIEIRNYAFAATTTLGSIVYSLKWFKTNKKIDLFHYTLFSILALYTHGYAIICIILIQTLTLLYSLIKKQDRIPTLIAFLLVYISFIPWVNILINQAQGIEESFWIGKPTDYVLEKTLDEIFSNIHIITIIQIILLIIPIIYLYIKDYQEAKKIKYLLIPSIGTLLFYYTESLLKTPMFIPKYVVPVSGILYLLFAFLLSKYKKKFNILIALFIILMIPNYLSNLKEEKQKTNELYTEQLIYDVNKYNIKEKTFYHFNEFSLGIAEYYFPDSKHYVDEKANIYVKTLDIFGNANRIKDIHNIKDEYIFTLTRKKEDVQKFQHNKYKIIFENFYNQTYSEPYYLIILKKEIK